MKDEEGRLDPVPPAGPGDLGARVSRNVELAWRATGRGVIEFYNSNNLTFAASIAYYSLVSMFPFVLLIISILGRITPAFSNDTLLEIIARALPSHFEFVSTQIQELARTPLKLSIPGTLVALLASMGVFGAVTSAVNHAWGVEEDFGFFKHKLIAFIMMLAAGVLLIVALFLVSAVQVAETRWFTAVVADHPSLGQLTGFVYGNAPMPLFVLVVGLIYYFVPNTRVRLRDVWFGAILAAVLWRMAFAGFSWYVRDLSRFSVHGSVAAVVVFLIWVYLSAVILLYGAEVTASYAKLRKEI